MTTESDAVGTWSPLQFSGSSHRAPSPPASQVTTPARPINAKARKTVRAMPFKIMISMSVMSLVRFPQQTYRKKRAAPPVSSVSDPVAVGQPAAAVVPLTF